MILTVRLLSRKNANLMPGLQVFPSKTARISSAPPSYYQAIRQYRKLIKSGWKHMNFDDLEATAGIDKNEIDERTSLVAPVRKWYALRGPNANVENGCWDLG